MQRCQLSAENGSLNSYILKPQIPGNIPMAMVPIKTTMDERENKIHPY